ncbi:MAG: phage portal protein [Pseudomonadota bacterium]
MAGKNKPEASAPGALLVRAQSGETRIIGGPEELAAFMRGREALDGPSSEAQALRALQLTAVWASMRIISGGVANLPIKVIHDLLDARREDRRSELYRLLRRRPNRYQRPKDFLRYGTACVMLRGEFFARKVRGGNGHIVELLPLKPGSVVVEQQDDASIIYKYTNRQGRTFRWTREEVLHVYLHTLNGITGATPIAFARRMVEGATAMEEHGTVMFKNGARVAGIFSTEKRLGPDGRENIRSALEDYRQGGSREGLELILEDGLTYAPMAMTPEDAQWIEARKLTKGEVFELYGIPMHMTALADKQSNWGTGVEEHNKAFITYVLEDYLTMWEDAFTLDVAGEGSNLTAEFDRKRLTRGDLQSQGEFYTAMTQSQVMTPNEVRSELGMNPREGGDEVLPLPNSSVDGNQNQNSGSEE